MTKAKTRQQRQTELHHLLATARGRRELDHLAFRYFTDAGWVRRHGAPIIPYILTHERHLGLILD
jgi:hypothetical protein